MLLFFPATAVGWEIQGASGPLARWLDVLTLIQGHQGDWRSCVVPWGKWRWDKSTEQVQYIPAWYTEVYHPSDCEKEHKCFFFFLLYVCMLLIASTSLFPCISDYMEKEQHCMMQGRGMHSGSQDSRSPDSACSLGYDSMGSSLDGVLNGEVSLWIKKKDRRAVWQMYRLRLTWFNILFKWKLALTDTFSQRQKGLLLLQTAPNQPWLYINDK